MSIGSDQSVSSSRRWAPILTDFHLEVLAAIDAGKLGQLDDDQGALLAAVCDLIVLGHLHIGVPQESASFGGVQ